MKAVIQRVKHTKLTVNGAIISEIAGGLVVYFGVAVGDTPDKAEYMAKKIVNMRIFEDEAGKMNLSVIDKGLEILSVSQFTLLADTSHGNRPGFTFAEKPEKANETYEFFCERLASYGVTVKRGVFGADMKIEQYNDGPVTIILEA
ncbi:MAG: D-tyrosyl-tRNA(Tyr) deacylase [Clostridia bacterium]|nr:D-tyrosyl-tRNA(Tyr) deacylase [Clostridia bacterium]